MSRVNVDIKATTDIRFQKIGRKLGLSKWDVRGRLEEIWLHCTIRQDYFITREDFEAIIPIENFFEAALEVDLLRQVRKQIYVCGTRGRIEWYGALKANSRKGGEANKRRIKQKQADKGEPVGYPDGKPDESRLDSPLTLAPALVPALILKYIKSESANADSHNLNTTEESLQSKGDENLEEVERKQNLVELRKKKRSSENSINTKTRVNSKTGTTYSEEFEKIYSEYPRREGKTSGFRIYQKEIRSLDDLQQLTAAVSNYRRAKCGTEYKYLLHFKTFMNQWRDWVEVSFASLDGAPVPRARTVEEILGSIA